MTLWRYMSLDKFINMFDDGGIYFAPLQVYSDSDPFEGYPPATVMKALYTLTDDTYDESAKLIAMANEMEKPLPQKLEELLDKIKKGIDSRAADFRKGVDVAFKGTVVSCWYYSDHQSEAMWKLYGDQGKGIAIRTTVGKLKIGLAQAVPTEKQKKIIVGKVRYLDYADSSLTPLDCVVDGHVVPLLKRMSYAHENEVRAFMAPDVDASSLDTFVIKPYLAKCNIPHLIDRIYVSPYASSPYIKAVQAVAKLYAVGCPVEASNLLSGVSELFKFHVDDC